MTVELTVLSRFAYRGTEITGPRLRGLLALLAAEPNGCGTSRLVDGLWPDDQPDNPTKALQILVSRLRSQFGDGLVERTPTGYRLALDENQVDASAVLLHAKAAAKHARAGDHLTALTEAEHGLALWDSPPKPDDTRDPLTGLRTERAVTYRTLARARALALARLNRHGEAVGPLTDLAAEYPRDEEILLELIKAEAATTSPATAMTRYDTYRRALRDELGADPGPALRQAYQELLQDEQPTVRHGVAHEPNPLLGRDADLDAVANLLTTARVVSVVGPGGLGKTRLAHAVSRSATTRTVHFVSLAGLAPDGDVAGEVAATVVEFTPPGGGSPVAGIVEALGAGALLVLDNCEHVLAATADLVATLVAMARDLRILTTSRAPLGLSSESVYLLPELDQATMEELFRQRATAARPGVDLPDDPVAELCARLDGLPLAVELAAARVRVLSAAEINRRLADRFALLRGGRRDAPERHHTLQAVVDWSWHLLDADSQAAFRALSVFPGGFTADAADHVLGRDSFDALEHLVDQSLLKVADTPAGARFRMLETVRAFGEARLAESGENVLDGYFAWVLDFAARHHTGVFGPDPVRTADLVRAEQDNLRLALRHGLARGDGAPVAAAASVLVGLWTIDANYVWAAALTSEVAQLLAHYRPIPEHVEFTRTAAALSVVITVAVQAPGAARMLYVLRRLPPAEPDAPLGALATVLTTPAVFAPDRAALRRLFDAGPLHVTATAGLILGYLAEQDGDLPAAIELSRPLLDAWTEAETPWLRVMSMSRLGELSLRIERSEESLEYFTEGVRVLRGTGAPRDVVGVYWGMMLANLQLGHLDEAEHWLGRATADNAGSPAESDEDELASAFMFVLAARAELALAKGEVDDGLRLWRRAAMTGPSGEPAPWAWETRSGALGAHARFGRLDLVPELLVQLPRQLEAMLANPLERPPVYVIERQLVGEMLVSLGFADIVMGNPKSGVRLVALAEHFSFLRGFRPTLTVADVRAVVEDADGPAYADALSEYAGLDRDGLRAAALAALRSRVSAAGRA